MTQACEQRVIMKITLHNMWFIKYRH